MLESGGDPGAYSAQSYISLSPSEVHLQANSPTQVNVTIKVPSDAGVGGRYAVIEFASETAASANGTNGAVGVGASVGAPVVVTLDGTAQTLTGDIRGIDLDRTTAPMQVKTTLLNTGNYHYGNTPHRMSASATLLDAQGNQVSSSVSPLTDGSVVPGFSRELSTDLAVPQNLPPGHYTVRADVTMEDGTIIDTDSKGFDLSAADVAGENSTPVNDNAGAPANSGGGSDHTWLYLLAIVAAAITSGLLSFFIFGRKRRPAQDSAGNDQGE